MSKLKIENLRINPQNDVIGSFTTNLTHNEWYNPNQYGVGNGYVIVDKSHVFSGANYNIVNGIETISVHGGLTFSNKLSMFDLTEAVELQPYVDYWVFGFDTAHCDDNSEIWTSERLQEETLKLAHQLREVGMYNPVTLRNLWSNIFFKIQGDDNMYFYDYIAENVYCVYPHTITEPLIDITSELMIRVIKEIK